MKRLLSNLILKYFLKYTAKKINNHVPKIKNDIENLRAALLVTESKYGTDKEAYNFINSLVFIRLSFMDILILQKRLALTKDKSEENLMARLLSLQLYEFFEDMGKIFGSSYSDTILNLPNSADLTKSLNDLRKTFNEFKKEAIPILKEIRHNTIAHKDPDAFKQLNIIENININEIAKFGAYITIVYASYSMFEGKLRHEMKKEMRKQ